MAEEEVNENTEGSEDGSEEEGKKGLDAKKILLFIIVPIILLLGGGAGLYFSGILGGGEEEAVQEDGEHAEDPHGETADSHGAAKKDAHGGGHGESSGHGSTSSAGAIFLPIENDILVNLNTSGSKTPRYLRMSGMQLELYSENDREAVYAVMPRILDKFNEYLRVLRVKDLQGSAGLYRLRIELLARVNEATYPVKVKNVLFKEVLVQ